MNWITITDKKGYPLRINLAQITHMRYDEDEDLRLYFSFGATGHLESIAQDYIYLTGDEIVQFERALQSLSMVAR